MPLVLLQERQRGLALLGFQVCQHSLLLLRGHRQQGSQLRAQGRGRRLRSLGLCCLRLRLLLRQLRLRLNGSLLLGLTLGLQGSLLLRLQRGLLLGLQGCGLLLLLWQHLRRLLLLLLLRCQRSRRQALRSSACIHRAAGLLLQRHGQHLLQGGGVLHEGGQQLLLGTGRDLRGRHGKRNKSLSNRVEYVGKGTHFGACQEQERRATIALRQQRQARTHVGSLCWRRSWRLHYRCGRGRRHRCALLRLL